ncbi:MAG: hypothetical protein SFY81_04195, partial [Verrucomicrobiota bacterium]|nr:hypothetical protein [Verrucomicrobiota bacterium]
MIASSPKQLRRLILLSAGLVIGFVGLGGKLVDLQFVRHEELKAAARKNTYKKIVVEPRRGDIRDKKGILLAVSKGVKTIVADPSIVGTNNWAIARTVAPILKMDVVELAEKLKPVMLTNSAGRLYVDRHVVLKRKVDEETWREIQTRVAALDFGFDLKSVPKKQLAYFQQVRSFALAAEPEEMRVYPNQSLPLSEDANIEEWPNSAVGQIQLRLERWTVEQFASVFIVRLPTLYGPGVTANPMHDLITSGRAHHINPVAIHQWYPLTRLERDIV